MKGRFIYICKQDSGHPDYGKYVQPTRRVYPTRADAERKAAGVAPSRKPIIVELPEPVEIGDDFYPVENSE